MINFQSKTSYAACVITLILAAAIQNSAQPKGRQISVSVVARPAKLFYVQGEPILIDIEIRNGLRKPITLYGGISSPSAWNGESLGIQTEDIYRLPLIRSIYLKRPTADLPGYLSGEGGTRIPSKKSAVRTVDLSKWQVVGGWARGKYQVAMRVDHITVDEYTKLSTASDPFIIEIR